MKSILHRPHLHDQVPPSSLVSPPLEQPKAETLQTRSSLQAQEIAQFVLGDVASNRATQDMVDNAAQIVKRLKHQASLIDVN